MSGIIKSIHNVWLREAVDYLWRPVLGFCLSAVAVILAALALNYKNELWLRFLCTGIPGIIIGFFIAWTHSTWKRCRGCKETVISEPSKKRDEYQGLLASGHQLMDRIKSQLVCAEKILSTSKYLEALLRGHLEADGRRLTYTVISLIDAHIWKIPNSEAELGYSVMAQCLEDASKWGGIHSADLRELRPSNDTGAPPKSDRVKHYFAALDNSKAAKKRIIMRDEERYALYKTPHLLPDDEKELIRFIARSKVECYLFNNGVLGHVFSDDDFPGAEPPPSEIKRDILRGNWPDCSIYNDRFFIEYNRLGASSFDTPGEIRIWATDIDPRNREDAEVRVAYLSRSVLFLFRYLTRHEQALDPNEFIKIDEKYLEAMSRAA